MAQGEQDVKCFKPMTHRGEDRPAEVFLRNENGTLVPFCGDCYGSFVKTLEETVQKNKDREDAPEDGPWRLHEEWLGKDESERKIPVSDGMAEFLEQEEARKKGEREGPRMTAEE